MSNAADEAQMGSGFSDALSTETPAAVVEAAPKVETTQAAPAASEPVDPIKEIMARLDKFQGGYDKLAGTMGRLQQNQEEIKSNLAAAQAATKTVQDAPTNAEVKEAMSDPEEWARLKASYPDWAVATEKLIDSRLSQAGGNQVDQAKIDKLVADRVAGETAAVRTEMIDSHLDSIVDGDWRAMVATPEFGTWLEAQPDTVKALGESSKMTDAAKMLRLYDASKRTPAPAPQQAAAPTVSTRQKRLEAAVTPKGSGGHGAASTEKDEMSSGFYGK